MSAHQLPYELKSAPFQSTDPGDGEPIVVDRWGQIVPMVVVASTLETNTLADPSQAGERLVLVAHTVGSAGSRAITAASGVNKAGNTVMLFDAANERLVLDSVPVSGGFEWMVTANDGSVALS